MSSKTFIVNELIWALEHRPRDFTATECVLYDKKSGQAWWLGNGCLNFALYQPCRMYVGFFNKFRAWAAIRRWQAQVLLETNHPAAVVQV